MLLPVSFTTGRRRTLSACLQQTLSDVDHLNYKNTSHPFFICSSRRFVPPPDQPLQKSSCGSFKIPKNGPEKSLLRQIDFHGSERIHERSSGSNKVYLSPIDPFPALCANLQQSISLMSWPRLCGRWLGDDGGVSGVSFDRSSLEIVQVSKSGRLCCFDAVQVVNGTLEGLLKAQRNQTCDRLHAAHSRLRPTASRSRPSAQAAVSGHRQTIARLQPESRVQGPKSTSRSWKLVENCVLHNAIALSAMRLTGIIASDFAELLVQAACLTGKETATC